MKNYTWNFGDGTSGNGSIVKHTYTDTGNYTVQLHVSNIIGCSDSIIKRIKIHGAFTMYIPNAFSPTSNWNNTFVPQLYNGELTSFVLFDRWGQKIHDGLNPWDGADFPEGVYMYYVTAMDYTGNLQTAAGTVHLLR